MWYEQYNSEGAIRLEDNMTLDDEHPDGVLPIAEKDVCG